MFAERLKRTRKAAGLSLRALAETMGLSHGAIQKFEKGELFPSSTQLIQWAEATGFRLEYFFRPNTHELEGIEFRKRSKLPKSAIESIKADVLDQMERILELESFFPESPVQAFQIPDSLPESISSWSDIEMLAENLRHIWELGMDPIRDLTETLENNGIKMLNLNNSDERFDGLCGYVNQTPVIVVSSLWPGDRQRFTMAHELGQILLEGRLADSIEEEKACNRFAGAFLAPARIVKGQLGTSRTRLEPRELLFLKRELGISMLTALFRAADLGIISAETQKSMFIQFSKRGWRTQEPEEYPAESPTLFNALVYRALGEELIGESKAAELFGIPVAQFHQARMLEDLNAAPSSHQ